MEDNKNLKPEESSEETKPQIHVNEYGATKDPAVVVDEADRTVLLTENETIVIEKLPSYDIPPRNRERKIYAGMWGTTELVTVGLSLLAILTTILLFIFVVVPAQRELANNRATSDEMASKLATAKSRYGDITTTEGRVAQLTTSVNDFETLYLPSQTTGQNAIYQQLNGLIAAYGLTNTSGPDYVPLDIADPNSNQQNGNESGKSKFASIYPGTYITMTLDGPYQNLRRFISDIESSRDKFVIISAVELEPSENKEKIDPTKPPVQQVNNPQPGVNPAGQNQFGTVNYQRPDQNQPLTSGTPVDRGKTRGETVTLRLEMATYFRRRNSVVQPQTASAQR